MSLKQVAITSTHQLSLLIRSGNHATLWLACVPQSPAVSYGANGLCSSVPGKWICHGKAVGWVWIKSSSNFCWDTPKRFSATGHENAGKTYDLRSSCYLRHSWNQENALHNTLYSYDIFQSGWVDASYSHNGYKMYNGTLRGLSTGNMTFWAYHKLTLSPSLDTKGNPNQESNLPKDWYG